MRNCHIFLLFLFFIIFGFFNEYPVYGLEGLSLGTSFPSHRRGENLVKVIDIKGKISIGHSLITPDQKGSIYCLENYQNQREIKSGDHLFGKLWGEHNWQEYRLSWATSGSLNGDDSGWSEEGSFEEACLTIPYDSSLQWMAGKKFFPWGKGSLLNPLGFINPLQDPFDDEQPQEGLVLLGGQYVKKITLETDPLQEFSFTTLLFPVSEEINKNFGQKEDQQEDQKEKWNGAGHLSLLFWNTEIEFCLLKGESKAERFGFAFSRQINNRLEVHGDFWAIPKYEKVFLQPDGQLYSTVYASFGSLYGLSYRFNDELSCVMEMYRSKEGFTTKEIQDYYRYVHETYNEFQETKNTGLMERIRFLTDTYYSQPLLMQEYVYGEMQKKNFLGIKPLLFSLKGLLNYQDKSYMMKPEIGYSLKPEKRIEIEGTWWGGKDLTEFGEKENDWLINISLIYFFDFSLYHLPEREEPSAEEGSSSSWR